MTVCVYIANKTTSRFCRCCSHVFYLKRVDDFLMVILDSCCSPEYRILSRIYNEFLIY